MGWILATLLLTAFFSVNEHLVRHDSILLYFVNGKLLHVHCCRYKGLQMNSNGRYNSGFWGQECGPEKDASPERVHKYMEDAISINTGTVCGL